MLNPKQFKQNCELFKKYTQVQFDEPTSLLYLNIIKYNNQLNEQELIALDIACQDLQSSFSIEKITIPMHPTIWIMFRYPSFTFPKFQ